MNKGKQNKVTVAEACCGTFIGTLVMVLSAMIFYRLLDGTVIYLRGLLALDLGAMAGVMVGLFIARAGYNERERARRRRERRVLRNWEVYKAMVRESCEKNFLGEF